MTDTETVLLPTIDKTLIKLHEAARKHAFVAQRMPRRHTYTKMFLEGKFQAYGAFDKWFALAVRGKISQEQFLHACQVEADNAETIVVAIEVQIKRGTTRARLDELHCARLRLLGRRTFWRALWPSIQAYKSESLAASK
jgi:hypothetical protein